MKKIFFKLPIPNSQLPTQKGFTLIEIMVVFTIATILAGIGIASFVSYSRSEQVNQTAGNIKLLINEAKFNSLSVVKTAANESGTKISCGDKSLVGYQIDVIEPDKIVMTQICNEVTPPDRTIKTITLPTGVSIIGAAPSTNCSQILFSGLSANVTGTPCAVKISGYQMSKTISVDLRGNTSVN